MRRSAPLLFLAALWSCDAGSSSAPPDATVSQLGGMVADPLGGNAYVADAARGLLIQFDLRSSSALRSRAFGTSVGPLAIDSSGERVALSLPDRAEVALFDVLTWRLIAIVPVEVAARALAFVDRDTVAVVRGSQLQTVDLRDGGLGNWQLPVGQNPQLRVDAQGQRLFVMDEQDRGAGAMPQLRVRCLSLDDPSQQPPRCITSDPMHGRGAAMQLDWDGQSLLVATRDDGQTFVLDSQLRVSRQDAGRRAETSAAAFNATGTRLYRALYDSRIHGIDLDRYETCQEMLPLEAVSEDGLLMPADGLNLLAHLEAGRLDALPLFELQLIAAPVARLNREFELELRGTPGDKIRVFAAERPGFLHLDPPGAPHPRFFDLELGSTQTLAQGQIGADGTARARFLVPFSGDLAGMRFVLQAASFNSAGGDYEVSNPVVVQLREPRLPR